MIDIIIPAYNAHSTIGKTLGSLVKQINRDSLCIYIINDGSKTDYSRVIENYNGLLNITEIKIRNSGPGKARQVGIDKSNNEFIVFVDADDELYNEYSILNLVNIINDADLAEGHFLEMKDDGSSNNLGPQHCYLHGKMYRRSIIEKFDIKFNSPKVDGGDLYEDSAFNQLYSLCTDKINSTDEIIYVYNYNPRSITKIEDNKIKNLQNYIFEMDWLMKEIQKRNIVRLHDLGWNMCMISFHIYFNYLITQNDSDFVFKKMKNIKKMYEKYIVFVPFEEQFELYRLFDNYQVIPNITFNDFLKKVSN